MATAGVALSAQTPSAENDQVRTRQRISTMEAVLERAISNGADNVLRQVSTVMPDRPMLSGVPQVRGFRLEGYGVFFHVQVPELILPILWPFRQMVHETQNRAAALRLQELQRQVALMPTDERTRLQLQRALRDVELQLDPPTVRAAQPGRVNAASLVAGAPDQQPPGVDPKVVDDPEAAYTREVKEALITAMLENSQALAIGAEEYLTVAARSDEPRNALFPGDTVESSTWVVRVKGSDLAAFRAGTVSADEVRKRVRITEE
jgi:hypothetical protein